MNSSKINIIHYSKDCLLSRPSCALLLFQPTHMYKHTHTYIQVKHQSQLYTQTQIQRLKQKHDCFYSYIQSHKDTLCAPWGFWDPKVCNLTGITVLGITLPDSIKTKKKKTLIHTKQTYFPSQANNKLI